MQRTPRSTQSSSGVFSERFSRAQAIVLPDLRSQACLVSPEVTAVILDMIVDVSGVRWRGGVDAGPWGCSALEIGAHLSSLLADLGSIAAVCRSWQEALSDFSFQGCYQSALQVDQIKTTFEFPLTLPTYREYLYLVLKWQTYTAEDSLKLLRSPIFVGRAWAVCIENVELACPFLATPGDNRSNSRLADFLAMLTPAFFSFAMSLLVDLPVELPWSYIEREVVRQSDSTQFQVRRLLADVSDWPAHLGGLANAFCTSVPKRAGGVLLLPTGERILSKRRLREAHHVLHGKLRQAGLERLGLGVESVCQSFENSFLGVKAGGRDPCPHCGSIGWSQLKVSEGIRFMMNEDADIPCPYLDFKIEASLLPFLKTDADEACYRCLLVSSPPDVARAISLEATPTEPSEEEDGDEHESEQGEPGAVRSVDS
eukprot:TRINITY_DN23929_c0_g1_i2.p1 TRINITY_DN23929_c0_g1~~TRINITY_DN23929_c0_g1_i2.p1  ORF type:complete len:427 (+),score=44.72 TRINITY_DN23929_c0_g1_i2:153-1433(+)